MNLAIRDVRRHLARFIGTAAGLGLLLSVVIAMQGIYAGMVDDATILTRAMRADLWIVQRDTVGPFAEGSRVDPTVEVRAAAVSGVTRARPYTYQVIQRDHHSAALRIALVGLGWPYDCGRTLPIVQGRRLQQHHGELVVDASLGLTIGETIQLGREPYRVVGLTRNALTSGGDSVAFVTLSDAQLINADQPSEAIVLERVRFLDRLRQTDLGRSQPALEDLTRDPRWRAPALSTAPIAAVLVNTEPHMLAQVQATILRWKDVTVYTQAEQEALLLGGVVERARMQIGLFTAILTLTAAVIIMLVIYNLTLEKSHDLAVLKLMGAPRLRLLGLVLQQAWLLGAIGYTVAFAIGTLFYGSFPRRVVITPAITMLAPLVTFVVVTLASVVGVSHVMRLDPAKALDG